MPNYNIAGIKIKIKPIYEDYFLDLLKPYLTKDSADYAIICGFSSHIEPIESTPLMVDKNRYFYKEGNVDTLQVYHNSGKIKYEIKSTGDCRTQEIIFVDELNQTKADMAYILISMAFLEVALRESFLPMHASSLLTKDGVILFSAPSRTGKSTHVNYYLSLFPHMENINDDKPLVKDGFVYGTPFSGKSKININTKHKLKAVVFIEQGKTSDIKRLSADEGLYLVLKNMLRPSDEAIWDNIIPNVNALLSYPLYSAHLTNEQQSIFTTYYGVFKETTMKLKSGFILKEIGTKIMVMPVDSQALNFNGVMTLNKTGKTLFEALQTEQTIDSLKQILTDTYDVDKEQALKDVIVFVETLKAKDLL